LAKSAAVTVTILNSSNTVIATPLLNKTQFGESVSSATVSWDGKDSKGNPASIGLYTVQVNATDLSGNNDKAITRSAQIAVASLSGSQSDPQKLFEDNVFVAPNPVRNGLGTFHFEGIRDGANISIKIYTLSGTLVFDKTFVAPAGIPQTYPWHAENQSGHKVGRGLYYYVVREVDAAGTLQTVKKMAVLP
jgi:flagellar hook assembly protein FlgD